MLLICLFGLLCAIGRGVGAKAFEMSIPAQSTEEVQAHGMPSAQRCAGCIAVTHHVR
jgi:hypothetical protein